MKVASDYFAKHGQAPSEGFCRSNPHPCLVETHVQTYGGAQRFQTRAGAEAFEAMIQEGYAREIKPEAKVFPVAKSTPTFPDKISVGRARNTDILVPDGDLSKLHALVHRQDGGFAISDADSKNGTFVNGRRLESGETRALHNDDLVWFGPRISFRFLMPQTFHARLVAMGASGAR